MEEKMGVRLELIHVTGLKFVVNMVYWQELNEG